MNDVVHVVGPFVPTPELEAEAKALFASFPESVRRLPMVVGGFLRQFYDEHPSPDVDLFFQNQEDLKSFERALWKRFGEPFELREDRTLRYRLADRWEINCIPFAYHSSLEAAVARVDMVCCAFGVEMAKDDALRFVCHVGAIHDADKRILSPLVRQSEERRSKRVGKFLQRGYTPADDFEDILASLPEDNSTAY